MGIIDFGIRITQKIAGDDALGNLQKLEKQMGASERALGRLENQTKSGEKALAALESQMAKMQASDKINIRDFEALTQKISAQKAKLGELATQTATARGKFGELGNAFQQLGGKGEIAKLEGLGASLEHIQSMGAALDPVVLIILGIVGALTAVVGVAVGAASALALFAFSAADAQRSLTITMTALSGSAEAGEANVAALERVANTTALAKGQIEQFARKLALAEIEGERFETTLRTLANVAAVAGTSAASHIESIIDRSKALGHFQIQDRALRGIGISFKDLAAQFGLTEAALKSAMKQGRITVEQGVDAINAAVTKRFGAGSAAMLLSFNVQLSKARERMAALFKDVDVEPLLVALQNILSLLDQNTTVGKALHDFFTATFNSLAQSVATYGPTVKAFLVGFAIGLVEAYIGLLLVKNAIEDAFGKSGKKIDAVQIGIWAAQAAVYALAFSVGALATFFGVLGAIVGVVVGPIWALWTALNTMFDLAKSLGEYIGRGLVEGVESAFGAFASAMKSLGQRGLDALNSVFHFGSPSKVMVQRGEWIDEGGAEGVEKGGVMARAMGGMASPTAVTPPAGGSSGAKPTLASLHIDKVVVEGGEGAGRRFLAELADACEEAGVSVGWGPEPEPSA